MFNAIKEFVFNLNPDIFIQAPARINLINPLDAVEGDFWMPSVAINGVSNPLSAFVYIKKTEKPSKLKIYAIRRNIGMYSICLEREEELSKDIIEFKKKFNEESKLIYASIYRFYKTNSLFWKKYLKENFQIGILTTIPRQSGLGGSAAIIIALLYGFARFFNLINNFSNMNKDDLPINKDIIAEMATKAEDEDLKITAGYADRYVICRGGLCFCSYYGKLLHKEISMEPLAVYDRIDKTYDIRELPIIICFSGVYHESGGVHGKLRRNYLKEEPRIINSYEILAEISWKSRFALLSRDWKLLGKYFQENTKIMNDIMSDAGFKYGIGLANNILITLIEDHPDVYAVKLTGAGGGGSVFALVNPDKIDNVLSHWQNRLNEIINNEDVFNALFPSFPLEITEKLRNAQFFKIKIDNGVKILNPN